MTAFMCALVPFACAWLARSRGGMSEQDAWEVFAYTWTGFWAGFIAKWAW